MPASAYVMNGIQTGTSCMVWEFVPSTPKLSMCRWEVSWKFDGMPLPNGGQIGNLQSQAGPHSLEVHNDYVGGPIIKVFDPKSCPVGTIERGGDCVRPPACTPPMVQNKAGVCACPEGTVQRGRECVPSGRPGARDPDSKPRDPRGDNRGRSDDPRGASPAAR